MRYGRDGTCAGASRAAARVTAMRVKARKARIIVLVRRGRLPFGAVSRDRKRYPAEKHQRRERHERSLVPPQDHEQARDEGSHRIAEAFEEAIDAIHGVVAVDADLLLAMLGHERALRGDGERLADAQQEHDAEEHEEAVG